VQFNFNILLRNMASISPHMKEHTI